MQLEALRVPAVVAVALLDGGRVLGRGVGAAERVAAEVDVELERLALPQQLARKREGAGRAEGLVRPGAGPCAGDVPRLERLLGCERGRGRCEGRAHGDREKAPG